MRQEGKLIVVLVEMVAAGGGQAWRLSGVEHNAAARRHAQGGWDGRVAAGRHGYMAAVDNGACELEWHGPSSVAARPSVRVHES